MENETKDVPYIVFESSMARAERHIKRLVIALIVAVFGIVATNIAWLIVWNSYEYVGDESSVEYVQDGGGVNVIGDGNFNGTEIEDKESDESTP